MVAVKLLKPVTFSFGREGRETLLLPEVVVHVSEADAKDLIQKGFAEPTSVSEELEKAVDTDYEIRKWH